MPTAIITGASAGIGKGVTQRLFKEGWNVILIARSTDKMNKIVKDYSNKYKIISCDLSKPQLLLPTVVPLIKTFLNENNLSGIDLLLNNAGGTHGGNIDQYTSINKLLPSFNWHIALMVTAPYLLTTYLSMNNLFNYNAAVINVGSLAAHYAAKGVGVHYQIAKSAVQGLTKCLAFELARKHKKNVRVNNLELGFVRTDILTQSNANITDKQSELFWKSMSKVTPLQKCGTVHDCVEFILFLTDYKKSGWLTGQDIVLDGGISLPMFHATPKL